MKGPTTVAVACGLVLVTFAGTSLSQSAKPAQNEAMRLGVFSISLAVKDIKASKAFYEKLDFKEVAGKLEQNWLILQNGTTTIGLFQGMFERNIMTFNLGLDDRPGDPRRLPGRARAPEHVEATRPEAEHRSRRVQQGPGELCPGRSGRQPDPVRSARAESEALTKRPMKTPDVFLTASRRPCRLRR